MLKNSVFNCMKTVIKWIHKYLLSLFVHTLKVYDSFNTYGDIQGFRSVIEQHE